MLFFFILLMNGYNYFCSTTTNYHRPSLSHGQSDIRSEESENENNDEEEDNSAET